MYMIKRRNVWHDLCRFGVLPSFWENRAKWYTDHAIYVSYQSTPCNFFLSIKIRTCIHTIESQDINKKGKFNFSTTRVIKITFINNAIDQQINVNDFKTHCQLTWRFSAFALPAIASRACWTICWAKASSFSMCTSLPSSLPSSFVATSSDREGTSISTISAISSAPFRCICL